MQNKVITIQSLESKASQGGIIYKLKDENNLTYTIFQTKSDGTDTKAYQGLKSMGNQYIGCHVEISYKEEQKDYQGKPYTARTILDMKPATSKPQSVQTTPPKTQPQKEVDWDAIAFGKCKTLFLVEAYKLGRSLADAEYEAEEWSKASMRTMPKQLHEQPIEQLHKQHMDAVEEIQLEDIPF